MKMKTTQDKTYTGETVVSGSGHVFADLGLSNPEERLAKAQLVHRIAEIIKERRLTQVEAGVILGIDQAKVSKLVRGRFSEFSTSTLMDFLTRLDQDVEIVVRPKPSSRETALLLVTIPD
jgi:predicted XRE-type DNA-binding protein